MTSILVIPPYSTAKVSTSDGAYLVPPTGTVKLIDLTESAGTTVVVSELLLHGRLSSAGPINLAIPTSGDMVAYATSDENQSGPVRAVVHIHDDDNEVGTVFYNANLTENNIVALLGAANGQYGIGPRETCSTWAVGENIITLCDSSYENSLNVVNELDNYDIRSLLEAAGQSPYMIGRQDFRFVFCYGTTDPLEVPQLWDISAEYVALPLQGTLRIMSTPAGARITLNRVQ